MPKKMAVIGGRRTRDLLAGRDVLGERIEPRETPFGPGPVIFRAQSEGGEFLFLCRHGPPESGAHCALPWKINYKANLFALRELGAEAIVSFASTQAVSHNFQVGQLVVPDDVLDETLSNHASFFEEKGVGLIRQWPVFCPELRNVIVAALADRGYRTLHRATFVCTQGLRMHTPAEVHKFATFGGDLLGHWLVPEAFLARELLIGYASLCFVVDYAETGSSHRPFEAGGLFGVDTELTAVGRSHAAVELFCELIGDLVGRLADEKVDRALAHSDCIRSMRRHLAEAGLGDDWRHWFD